jgi:hypothetical protein
MGGYQFNDANNIAWRKSTFAEGVLVKDLGAAMKARNLSTYSRASHSRTDKSSCPAGLRSPLPARRTRIFIAQMDAPC